MVIKPFNSANNGVKYMQQGGMAPEAAPMPAEAPTQGGMDQQLEQIAGELLNMLLQNFQDPNLVAAVLETALTMLSQSQTPVGATPEEGMTFMRNGGSITIAKCGKKLKCGGKAKKSKKC